MGNILAYTHKKKKKKKKKKTKLHQQTYSMLLLDQLWGWALKLESDVI